MNDSARRRDVLKGLAALSATSSLTTPVRALVTPGPSVSEGWDLSALYSTEAAFEADRARAQALIARAATFSGRLGSGAATLFDALQVQSDARRTIGRMTTFAQAKAAEDTRLASAQARVQLVRQLAGSLDRASSFTAPQIVALGSGKVDAYFAADPRLARFRFKVADMLRLAPHTLGEEAETVIAATSVPFGGPLAVVNQMNASDIPRPTLTLADGRRVRLDEQGFEAASDSPDRADRKRVFEAFFASLQPFQNTLGIDLLAQVQQEVFTAQVRRYPDALSAALDPLGIPVDVYRTFIREVNAGLPAYRRYLDLRRKLLGVPRLAVHDLYVPLGATARRFTPQDMRANLLAAAAPLGSAYVAKLAEVTTERWADPLPRPNKLPGNYMDPGAYDVHPYLMFNLVDDYRSMTDYVHEWGHAMHSVLADQTQPYETSGYASFVAEVPSQLNEILLARHMIGTARSRSDRLFYLIQLLELWSGHFFKTGLRAEFQDMIHAPVEQGGALTGVGLTAAYLMLLRRYYGEAVEVDPVYGVEWARNFQFWEGYYTFQYATCITASGIFADDILAGRPGARDRYLGVLRAGGSDHAYTLLRDAGIDLATPAPYRRAIQAFERLVDQASRLMG